MLSVICSVSDMYQYDKFLGQSLRFLKDVELIMVRGNESIFRNYAEGVSRARFLVKVFVHQDVNLGSSDWVEKVISTFDAHLDVGLLGMVGTTKLQDQGMWWESGKEHLIGELYSGEEKADWVFRRLSEPTYCECVDGFFMATNKDIPWDTSLNGFHLYDMDYCREATKRGYRIMAIPHKAWHIGKIRTVPPDFGPYYEKWGINAA